MPLDNILRVRLSVNWASLKAAADSRIICVKSFVGALLLSAKLDY